MSTVLRTTARLDEQEAAFAARMKMTGTDEAAAMRELTGYEDLSHAPAATIVHALIEVGIKTVRDKAEEVGRVRLTEFLRTDPEHLAWRNSRRQRGIFRNEGAA